MKRKLIIFDFFALFFLILLLPGQSYYEKITQQNQPSAVLSAHFVLPPIAPRPVKITTAPLSDLTAQAVYVMDLPSGSVLYQKEAEQKMLPASTVKMMTALTALTYFSPNDVLVVPEKFRDGQNLKLVKGEKMTMENLLYCLLVASANDAAETLAANYPGGRSAFVEQMNALAIKWNLNQTHFVNPTGIDQEGQYSSARDLALLAKIVLNDPLLSKIVATKNYTAYSQDGKMRHSMSNINLLLNQYPGVKGVKTGWTDLAGECLVGYLEKDNRRLISVVLGSNDRFGETIKIFNWVLDNFSWESSF